MLWSRTRSLGCGAVMPRTSDAGSGSAGWQSAAAGRCNFSTSDGFTNPLPKSIFVGLLLVDQTPPGLFGRSRSTSHFTGGRIKTSPGKIRSGSPERIRLRFAPITCSQ